MSQAYNGQGEFDFYMATNGYGYTGRATRLFIFRTGPPATDVSVLGAPEPTPDFACQAPEAAQLDAGPDFGAYIAPDSGPTCVGYSYKLDPNYTGPGRDEIQLEVWTDFVINAPGITSPEGIEATKAFVTRRQMCKSQAYPFCTKLNSSNPEEVKEGALEVYIASGMACNSRPGTRHSCLEWYKPVSPFSGYVLPAGEKIASLKIANGQGGVVIVRGLGKKLTASSYAGPSKKAFSICINGGPVPVKPVGPFPAQPSSSKGMSTKTIVGIVFGSIAGALLIGIVIYLALRKKRIQNRKKNKSIKLEPPFISENSAKGEIPKDMNARFLSGNFRVTRVDGSKNDCGPQNESHTQKNQNHGPP
jgi:hypothetical protein